MIKEWVTVYTDASVLSSTEASCAIWFKSNNIREQFTWKSQYKGWNIFDAEMFSILVALDFVDSLHREGLVTVEGVVIKNDNKHVVESFWPTNRNRRKQNWGNLKKKDRILLFKKIISYEERFQIRTMWIKGHQRNGSVQAWLNNWCDANTPA